MSLNLFIIKCFSVYFNFSYKPEAPINTVSVIFFFSGIAHVSLVSVSKRLCSVPFTNNYFPLDFPILNNSVKVYYFLKP